MKLTCQHIIKILEASKVTHPYSLPNPNYLNHTRNKGFKKLPKNIQGKSTF